MKKNLNLIIIIVLISNLIYAQSNDVNKLEILVGGSFAKPKIIPKMDKLAIAQITVNYKLTTTAKTATKEKSSGAIAGAKITAYLETTDGELTATDFQEVTDYFYFYFQKKLKENGIDTVGWNTIVATDFYKNADEKTEKEKKEKDENVWVTSTAHKGNILYGGGIAFAFGKIKKASKFCEQIGAPAGFFHLTVDFADVLVGLDIKTLETGYSVITRTRTWKYDAAWEANMKIVPSTPGISLFWNKKSQSESLIVKKDIKAGVNFHDAMNQDPSKLKNSLWAFRKEMNPIVIETTREKYKTAAKKALEKYADAFITKTKS